MEEIGNPSTALFKVFTLLASPLFLLRKGFISPNRQDYRKRQEIFVLKEKQ